VSESVLSSVVRALSILKLFNHERRELSFMEIVKLTNIPKSSTHRLIRNLVNEGFLSQNPRTNYYRLGLDILGLGGVIYSRHQLYHEALPLVRELSKELEESAQICFLENDEVTYLIRVESHHPDHLLTQIGHKNPIHCTSEGLCILAYQNKRQIEKVVQSHLYAYTDRTPTTRAALSKELQFIRKNGYCIAEETYFKNYTSIAAPIRNHIGQVVSSLSMIGRTRRFYEQDIDVIVNKIKHYAQKISEHLGFYD